MRYLLDTHTFAWAVGDPSRLSPAAHAVVRAPENTLLVSAVSTWEMSIKHHLGKWPEVAPFLDDALYATFLEHLRAEELPIMHAHARLAGQWNLPHRDPFDRMLAAQATLEGVPILSADTVLGMFPVQRVW
ncbi:PIN domain nuclease of toxin-antitoxin system [Deinococcus metalli]|uniref:PIN domain nuclease of toxin-antitoxin system n=1 Tax=Deinococcus metalli TaxID=1141878 RepID=A0A7W8KJP3_9DEIO|nr:type II toxin-antitoxin system VapC family toxin [Deinococcus metalli]MBB5379170.1 PIN domain nuclease of toxin-antitoxin system [Deinococcus metalli]GHF64671.1 twitching motility protein PilT [Deinococcus metalli]